MMQKLMKNWIFTLVTCILLTILSVLMFLDGAGVGDLFIGQKIIHVLTAVALAVYVILALCPMVPKYHTRSGRSFLLAEIVILTVTVIAQIGVELFRDIPWLSDLAVCSVLGLAIWLRSFVLIVRAYLLQGITPAKANKEGTKKNARHLSRTPLWRLCLYIIMGSFGVSQMVKPLVKDQWFVFCIATAAAVFAIIFAIFTVENHKACPKKPAKKKKPETVADAANEIVAALPGGNAAPVPATEPAPDTEHGSEGKTE